MNSKINAPTRLSKEEILIITKTILGLDASAVIFLYGSKVDANKRGGDIDLLIISQKLIYNDKLDLLVKLKDQLGDQKIDLSIKTQESYRTDPFFSSPEVQKQLVQIN